MARSVSYPRGSIVAFRLFNEDEDEPGWTYDCLVEDVVSSARSAFPSLQRHEGWRGREDRILLRNAFCPATTTMAGSATTMMAGRIGCLG